MTETSIFRVTLTLDRYQNGTEIEQIVTFTSNYSLTNAIIVNNINQPVNGSLCQITSLEVYRGKEHSTKVSHHGFSLSNEGTFQVNQNLFNAQKL